MRKSAAPNFNHSLVAVMAQAGTVWKCDHCTLFVQRAHDSFPLLRHLWEKHRRKLGLTPTAVKNYVAPNRLESWPEACVCFSDGCLKLFKNELMLSRHLQEENHGSFHFSMVESIYEGRFCDSPTCLDSYPTQAELRRHQRIEQRKRKGEAEGVDEDDDLSTKMMT